MEFIIKTQSDILKVNESLMNIIEDLKQGKQYYCELKKYRKKRSLDANSYFHLLVSKIAQRLGKSFEEIKVQMNLDYGTIASDDNGLKVGFKALKEVQINSFFKYAKPIGECLENGKVFVKYLIFKETHTLDSSEMSHLINGTIQEAKQLGIETITPQELVSLEGYLGESQKLQKF